MAIDSGLAGDTCVFVEAVAGDGGNHAPGVWWLSPDIQLSSGVTGMPDKADPGPNPVVLRAHVHNNCTLSDPQGRLKLELYVGNPSLVMTPTSNTVLITNPPEVVVGAVVGVNSRTVTWTVPSPSSNPIEQPGHKCLVLRAFQNGFLPDPGDLSSHVGPTQAGNVGDQHYAQHNICIVPCGGPGAANRPGGCSLPVSTANANPDKPETVLIRSWFDGQPEEHVRRVVLDRLSRVDSFRRLATAPPVHFSQRIPEIPDARPFDNTRKRRGCLGQLFPFGGSAAAAATYDLQAKLEPGQTTDVIFTADLSGASFGDAYIFHMKQVGESGHDQGGLTVVMVAG